MAFRKENGAKEVGLAGAVGPYERGEGPKLQLLNGRNALEALYGNVIKPQPLQRFLMPPYVIVPLAASCCIWSWSRPRMPMKTYILSWPRTGLASPAQPGVSDRCTLTPL